MIASDASTLILLAKAEILEEFLGSLEHEVAIDPVVAQECCGNKPALDGLVIQRCIREKRIRVRTTKQQAIVQRVRADFALGAGEAATIALAMARKAALVLIDDKQGINVCKLLKLPFATALTILVRMHEKRVLSRDGALRKLALLAHYGRYRKELVEQARTQLEE